MAYTQEERICQVSVAARRQRARCSTELSAHESISQPVLLRRAARCPKTEDVDFAARDRQAARRAHRARERQRALLPRHRLALLARARRRAASPRTAPRSCRGSGCCAAARLPDLPAQDGARHHQEAARRDRLRRRRVPALRRVSRARVLRAVPRDRPRTSSRASRRKRASRTSSSTRRRRTRWCSSTRRARPRRARGRRASPTSSAVDMSVLARHRSATGARRARARERQVRDHRLQLRRPLDEPAHVDDELDDARRQREVRDLRLPRRVPAALRGRAPRQAAHAGRGGRRDPHPRAERLRRASCPASASTCKGHFRGQLQQAPI